MTRITIEEFQGLPQQEQCEVIGMAAEFVDATYSGYHRKEVFNLDHFFVEVHSHLINKDIILITAFEEGSMLDKYSSPLDESLTDLLQH